MEILLRDTRSSKGGPKTELVRFYCCPRSISSFNRAICDANHRRYLQSLIYELYKDLSQVDRIKNDLDVRDVQRRTYGPRDKAYFRFKFSLAKILSTVGDDTIIVKVSAECKLVS